EAAAHGDLGRRKHGAPSGRRTTERIKRLVARKIPGGPEACAALWGEQCEGRVSGAELVPFKGPHSSPSANRNAPPASRPTASLRPTSRLPKSFRTPHEDGRHEPVRPDAGTFRFHADRAAGGHCDHRGAHRPAAPRRPEGPRSRQPHELHEQTEAARPG